MEYIKYPNTLIIGSGAIGAFYDTPESEYILSHAHAFSYDKNFNLIGFVDVNNTKGQQAAKIWNTEYFETIEDAFEQNKIDIVCICVPDEFHYEILKKVADFSVKLVFTEKPFTSTVDQGEEIIQLYKQKNIPILVNYSRRFIEEFQLLKKQISDNLYGKLATCNVIYGKGLFHNGSHAIDLLNYFFNIKTINNISIFNKINDYQNDPTITCRFDFDIGNVNLIGIDSRLYSIFEIDLIFETGRIKILNSGATIEIYHIVKNDLHRGYVFLENINTINVNLYTALPNAVNNIYQYLINNITLLSTGQSALNALKICKTIQQKYGENSFF